MFKKILSIIDFIELNSISKDNTYEAIIQQLEKDDININEFDIPKCLSFLWKYSFIKDTAHGIDLSPASTIFAKADSNSCVEAISLFESLYQNVEIRSVFQRLLHQKMHKIDVYSKLDETSYSLLTQTSLFYTEKDEVILRKEYIGYIQSIIDEYENSSPLLSTTLCALYTTSIIAHENTLIEYKNLDKKIVPYPLLSTILSLIPRLGVPSDRNETKALQSFYKDTLFHEYNHHCPICGIDMPHLLIASHIKPFRDCAHLYEAIDHNNGLLLCRNHDYLFDQGFISFQDDGSILISQALKDKNNNFAYALTNTYCLPIEFMTTARRLFLAYHRDNIFKK